MPTVIPDYPSNADHPTRKTQKPKMEQVTTGKVTTAKPSATHVLKDILLPVVADAMIPTLKDALVSIVTDSINVIVYGDSGSSAPRTTASSISYGRTNYSRISSSRNQQKPVTISSKRQNFDDLIFANRGEAEEVLDRLREAIGSYGCVTVLDAYDLCGQTAPYTSDKYGWTDLENAYIERTRQGYVIRFPRALPID